MARRNPLILTRPPIPQTAVEQRELAARLRDLLRELPAPQREAIDLWCEGFTAKEIAAITGRTEGNVRVLTHRGLTALRSHPAIRHLLATVGGDLDRYLEGLREEDRRSAAGAGPHEPAGPAPAAR